MRTGVHRYQLAAHSAATQNMLSSIDLFRHNDLSSPESASNVPSSLRYLARDIVRGGVPLPASSGDNGGEAFMEHDHTLQGHRLASLLYFDLMNASLEH